MIIACVPAYNEDKTIAKVIILAQKHVDKVIVCDDGSVDMTGEIARRLGAEVLRHERNIGYGDALGTLFRRAKELDADVVVTIDSDGQHDPEDIPLLVKPLLTGNADIVIGSRFIGKEGNVDMPWYRSKGIRMITDLTNKVTDLGLSDAQCGFRAYSKRALKVINPSEPGMGVSTEILEKAAEAGLGVIEIPVSVRYKGLEVSTHYPLFHGLDVVATTLKRLSIRHPLLFYGLPALVFVAMGMFFGVWAMQVYVFERQLWTNAALIAAASVIIGLMLGTTAVILYTLISVIREHKL